MNTFKTLGIAIMLSLSLLLSGVACVLIAVSIKHQQPIGDADVVVSGMGIADNEITVTSHRRLVREVMDRGVAPPITSDVLQTTVDALIDRAKRGDADAADFVFELAAAQRAKGLPQTRSSEAAR